MAYDSSNSEGVLVVIRIKKESNDSDISLKVSNNLITLIKPKHVHRVEKEKQFSFNAVYNQDKKTKEIYDIFGYNILNNIFEGYNGTILCYGATNSGKTFTMSSDPDGGLIQSFFPDLFLIKSVHSENIIVTMAYYEIYKNEVKDLMYYEDPLKVTMENYKDVKLKRSKEKLEIHENAKGFYVAGLTTYECPTPEYCLELYEKGRKNRITASTKSNLNSSRSHAILKISLIMSDNKGTLKGGNLFLVDLAGAEQLKKSEVDAVGLAEAKKINLDMLALTKVIINLSKRARYVPYRDSSLTKLLSNALGGNSKTVFIANISPLTKCYEETLNVLRYAHAAKLINNVAEINEDEKDKLIRVLKEENKKLNKEIEDLRQSMLVRFNEPGETTNTNDSDVEVSADESDDNEDRNIATPERKIRQRRKVLKFKVRQLLLNDEYIEQINAVTNNPNVKAKINKKLQVEIANRREKAKKDLILLLRNNSEFTKEELEIIDMDTSELRKRNINIEFVIKMHELIKKQYSVVIYQKAEIDNIIHLARENEDTYKHFDFHFENNKNPNAHTQKIQARVCTII